MGSVKSVGSGLLVIIMCLALWKLESLAFLHLDCRNGQSVLSASHSSLVLCGTCAGSNEQPSTD